MNRIGRYIIEAELGTGAMGVVYLAVDPRLQRRIAVKTYHLPDAVSAEMRAEFHERFLREARAAAALSHPSIVTVYDAEIDTRQDAPFIAMEFVEGRTLKDLLDEKRPLEPRLALSIASAIADALQVAHDAGIVHRDVKPANVLVRAGDGIVKLADFGVARLSMSELTRSGTCLGSPAYMSPEQVRGDALDGRSDLFALAVIVYEMLTGERPFAGDELGSIVYAIVHETPLPATRRLPSLPPTLDAFFDRALAKDPARRLASGIAFREALERALSSPAPQPGTPTVVSATALNPPAPAPANGLLGAAWNRVSKWRRRRVAAAILAAALGGWLLLGDDDVQLRLDGKSSIESGTFSILVDGDVLYTRELSAPQRRKGLLKKVLPQQNQETFEAWLDVPSGKHEIVAQVMPIGYRDTIVVDLEPSEQRTLRVVAGRTFGTPLLLELD